MCSPIKATPVSLKTFNHSTVPDALIATLVYCDNFHFIDLSTSVGIYPHLGVLQARLFLFFFFARFVFTSYLGLSFHRQCCRVHAQGTELGVDVVVCWEKQACIKLAR